MQLTRKNWTNTDILEYENYLLSFSKGEETAIRQKIIANTEIPTIGVPMSVIKKFSKEIYLGNYREFLEVFPRNNHSEILVIGNILSRMKDFDEFSQYLAKYSTVIDNWEAVDTLKFSVKDAEKEYLELSDRLIKSPRKFDRRIGIRILFSFIDEDHLDYIFNVAENLQDEQEYYVNMCLAWLLSECMVKERDKTLDFLYKARLSKFVLQKTVSKCRDSFRVSSEDKLLLKNFLAKKLGEIDN